MLSYSARVERSPLVTIVLPTYNRASLLAYAIASVLDQTHAHWELIVVDDGSDDETARLIPPDRRIKYLRRAHTGNVAATRNAGLARAAGEFVVFLDSDDRMLPRRLEAQLARLAKRPDCGWCHSDFRMVDARGGPIPRKAGLPWTPREGDLRREVLTTDGSIALHTVMVRRTLAARLQFDERVPFGDDYDFLVRLAEAAPGCAVDLVAVEIREHPARGAHGRYDQSLHFALTYVRCWRRMRERHLRAICRARAIFLLRHYLAVARARGELTTGVWEVARALAGRRARN